MRSFPLWNLLAALFSAFSFSILWAEDPLTVNSPNELVSAAVSFDTGQPLLSVNFADRALLSPSAVVPALDPPLEGGLEVIDYKIDQTDRISRCVWGPAESVSDKSSTATVTLREKAGQKRTFNLQVRVSDSGAAYRFVFPKDDAGMWKITADGAALNFGDNLFCWPIYATEGTYPAEPVALSAIEPAKTIFLPFTFRVQDVRCSLLEVAGDAWARMNLVRNEDNTLCFTLCAPVRSEQTTGPWHMLLVAESDPALITASADVWNLAASTAAEDFSWVVPGKTLSNEWNCDINTNDLKSMVDFAADCSMKYLQIDWGWYGTEVPWSREAQETWFKTNPDVTVDRETWDKNVQADPYTVASGMVPYLPTWTSRTWVDLDLPELIRYGREKGIGICLYVNDAVLRTHDLEDLFAVYRSWGLAGLKPGFVRYGDQASEEAIERMVRIAAKNKLWLCVHDAYIPNGYDRTYPNLMCVEGGGGQEGGHPDWQDVVLPFARCLAGPFDYTPALFVGDKSHAHQLSLLVTLFNPSPVIRGGWRVREAADASGFGTELEFLRRCETTAVRSEVLAGSIGHYLAVARLTPSGFWQLGVTNARQERTLDLSLDFLQPDCDYTLTLWEDAPQAEGPQRGTVKSVRTVRAGDTLPVHLAPAGGAVAIIETR